MSSVTMCLIQDALQRLGIPIIIGSHQKHRYLLTGTYYYAQSYTLHQQTVNKIASYLRTMQYAMASHIPNAQVLGTATVVLKSHAKLSIFTQTKMTQKCPVMSPSVVTVVEMNDISMSQEYSTQVFQKRLPNLYSRLTTSWHIVAQKFTLEKLMVQGLLLYEL